MGLIDTLKDTLTSEGDAMYRCEECDETFTVEMGVTDPACDGCGAESATFVRNV